MSFYATYPSTAVSSGPIQFYLDGSPIYVSQDSGAPANSVPLPVVLLDGGGVPIGFNTNYGASTGALRTAAQIGNSTGQADFGAGVTGAQTLRVEANQGAANATPWNIAAASLPLPTGAATEVTLSALNGKFSSLGQKTMAASAPVALASDQSAIPVTGPLTDVQLRAIPVPVSGTVAVTGVATEATLAAMSAKLPATLGQKTSANSLAVVLSSDQSVIPVSPSGGASGNSPGSGTVSIVATITAPANALGFILMNLDTSTTNMRYRIGGTAAVASGQQLQPGRDTGYIPCGANISIIAESGTCNYDIQWVIR